MTGPDSGENGWMQIRASVMFGAVMAVASLLFDETRSGFAPGPLMAGLLATFTISAACFHLMSFGLARMSGGPSTKAD